MRRRPPRASNTHGTRSATEIKRELAREQRANATPAERVVREALRRRGRWGIKFRFIHPLAGFLLDFYAPAIRLCIEIDGAIHDDRCEYDEERSRILASLGVRVLRLRSEEVLTDLQAALAKIDAAILESRLP